LPELIRFLALKTAGGRRMTVPLPYQPLSQQDPVHRAAGKGAELGIPFPELMNLKTAVRNEVSIGSI
jgi:hypothetical protein